MDCQGVVYINTINVKKSSISIQTELCIRLLKQKAVAQEWLLTL